jgi:hypothetical protein
MKKLTAVFLILLLLLVGCTAGQEECTETEDIFYGKATVAKPVIYLYPEEETSVTVKLDYDGLLTVTYPAYQDGWHVLARPDGTLTDLETGLEYSYLFWEGERDADYDMSRGFVVRGEDTAAFLQKTLAQMGLTPREYNEFIVYWLPQMQGNAYNLITFQQEAYTDSAKLEILPKPDSVLRVFMAFKPLEAPVQIEAPEIKPFERIGFTVVEWGGTALAN